RRGDHAGWNLYENNQPAGYILPVIKYRTNGFDTLNIVAPAMAGATRSGGVVTFVTTFDYNFHLGEKITVTGVADPSFIGTFYVSTITSRHSFTVLQAGPDAVSGGGTIATQPLGGAVTGGTFYDATDFPPRYRQNFFFGD